MNVSVVIPVYNEEHYIGICLDSLKKQIVPPYEIIIVDNNCSDKTVEIAKRYPVRVVREEKQGMIFARNRGFEEVRGDIIARCDADVVLPENWIKTIKEEFKKDEIIGLTGPSVFYDYGISKRSTLPFTVYARLMKLVLGTDVLIGPNMVLRKSGWDKIRNQVCLNDKVVHEDIDLSIHLAKYGKIKVDSNLQVKISGRRLKSNPLSFFVEYPIRLISTLRQHKK